MFKKVKHEPALEAPDAWFAASEDGQLAVDVFRHGSELIVRSTVAGVSPDDLDIAINGDLLTIRGSRMSNRDIMEDDWFHRECYWGAFSRSIILPLDVEADKAEASIKHGVLEIRIPLRGEGRRISITSHED